MNFYAYIPKNGKEPLGTAGRVISRKYKSLKTFLKYGLYNPDLFRVFTFQEFYKPETFKLVKKEI